MPPSAPSRPSGPQFALITFEKHLRKDFLMKVSQLCVITALSLGAVPLLTGCDETIEKQESTEVKRDGTVVKEKEEVKQQPDGTIIKEEEKKVDQNNDR
jgi:hypothetical protein